MIKHSYLYVITWNVKYHVYLCFNTIIEHFGSLDWGFCLVNTIDGVLYMYCQDITNFYTKYCVSNKKEKTFRQILITVYFLAAQNGAQNRRGSNTSVLPLENKC